jgi:hypothetical protein
VFRARSASVRRTITPQHVDIGEILCYIITAVESIW